MGASVAKTNFTILVVDDDEEVLALTVDVLEMAGYTVLSTRSAPRATARPHSR
jgi:CheY-like chemotaxis protein